MPELTCSGDIEYLKNQMSFGFSDKEASQRFQQEIDNTINGSTVRILDNAIHNIKHVSRILLLCCVLLTLCFVLHTILRSSCPGQASVLQSLHMLSLYCCPLSPTGPQTQPMYHPCALQRVCSLLCSFTPLVSLGSLAFWSICPALMMGSYKNVLSSIMLCFSSFTNPKPIMWALCFHP